MSESAYQFSVIRFVPDLVRDEAVNIGVIVRAHDLSSADVRFLVPSALARKTGGPKLIPQAQALEGQLRTAIEFRDVDPSPVAVLNPKFFDIAHREFHGHIRLSDTSAIMAEGLPEATERVFATYVTETPKAHQLIASTAGLTPSRFRQRLWSTFKRAELFGPGRAKQQFRMRGRHAEWEFDVGYKNGGISLINAIALNNDNAQTNLDRALLYKGMIDEVSDQADVEVKGVCVVTPPPKHPAKAAYNEAQGILVDAKIVVVPFDDLGHLAIQVKEELEGHIQARLG